MNRLIKTLNTATLGLVIILSGSAISPGAFADRDRTWSRDGDRDRSTNRDYSTDRHRSTDKRASPKRHNDSRRSSQNDHNYNRHRTYSRKDNRHYYPSPYRRDWHHHNYRYYFPLSDFIKFFAVTVITFKILDILNEDQQRKHEEAMSRAMDARVGDEIRWEDEDVTGMVKPTRNGVNAHGQPCREFQQTVTIGGRSEQAYGTACRQPDGSWQIVQ